MRRQDDVGQCPERRVGRGRLGPGDVEDRVDATGLQLAESASSSTRAPRAVLMNVAPSGRAASSRRRSSQLCWAAAARAVDTTRLVRISSSRLISMTPRDAASSTPTVGSDSATVRSNGARSSITRRPMADAPMIPTWVPYVPNPPAPRARRRHPSPRGIDPASGEHLWPTTGSSPPRTPPPARRSPTPGTRRARHAHTRPSSRPVARNRPCEPPPATSAPPRGPQHRRGRSPSR